MARGKLGVAAFARSAAHFVDRSSSSSKAAPSNEERSVLRGADVGLTSASLKSSGDRFR